LILHLAVMIFQRARGPQSGAQAQPFSLIVLIGVTNEHSASLKSRSTN
jgi:hypothetical protein